jgi:membrane-bound ClpP family serine protease
MDLKNKILWGISMIGLIGISYWLCRFYFFEMHGMKQWPNLLAILSLAIILIAAIFGNRIISVATVVGYMGGFILAMIFNTDGVDPGGGRTNNAWVIWGAVLICAILIGIIFAFIFKQRRKTVRG